MPDFAYTARSSQGQDSSGVISAGSRREAIALLAEQSLFPLRRGSARRAEASASWRFALRRRIKSEVLADTFTQLSDLLTNGVPLLESLDVLVRQTVDQRLAEVLKDVRAQVADGTGLDAALASHRGVFSPLAISMVRAGLEGAFLEEALERIAGFLRKQEALRMKVHRVDDLSGHPGGGRRRRDHLPGDVRGAHVPGVLRSSGTDREPGCRW